MICHKGETTAGFQKKSWSLQKFGAFTFTAEKARSTRVDRLDKKNAPVATATVIARGCSYPGGAVVASQSSKFPQRLHFGTIQRRLAWPQCVEDTPKSGEMLSSVFHCVFSHSQ